LGTSAELAQIRPPNTTGRIVEIHRQRAAGRHLRILIKRILINSLSSFDGTRVLELVSVDRREELSSGPSWDQNAEAA